MAKLESQLAADELPETREATVDTLIVLAAQIPVAVVANTIAPIFCPLAVDAEEMVQKKAHRAMTDWMKHWTWAPQMVAEEQVDNPDEEDDMLFTTGRRDSVSSDTSDKSIDVLPLTPTIDLNRGSE